MKRIFLPVLLTSILVMSACTSHYQYSAYGKLGTANGDARNAVIYWHGEEGRLWYLRKYAQLDSDLTLRICEQSPKIFVTGNDGFVELQSKANDLRVARIDANGELVMLPAEQRLRTGSRCGMIRVDGLLVGTDGLSDGLKPEVLILCRAEGRPDRYPRVGRYPFEAIGRKAVDKSDRSGPNPCPDT